MTDDDGALGWEVVTSSEARGRGAVEVFERSIAAFFGTAYAVAVSSGTAALHCALAAYGIGPGDEVLVPAVSVVMSAVPVLYQGAKPVFVDSAVDRVDFDYDDLESKVTPRTRAVIPVYMWGCSHDQERLIEFAERYHIGVIEDACQAHGSTWAGKYLGTFGDLGCFSMHQNKLLSVGEGGFILTDNRALAEECRSFADHFSNPGRLTESYAYLGHNYRLSPILAEIALARLNRLAEAVSNRIIQSQYIVSCVGDETLVPYEYRDSELSNRFSPLLLYAHNEQSGDASTGTRFAQYGVLNSTGTFGLAPAWRRLVFKDCCEDVNARPSPMPNADRLLHMVLAINMMPNGTMDDATRMVDSIKYAKSCIMGDEYDRR
jgi:perosamine synthetase